MMEAIGDFSGLKKEIAAQSQAECKSIQAITRRVIQRLQEDYHTKLKAEKDSIRQSYQQQGEIAYREVYAKQTLLMKKKLEKERQQFVNAALSALRKKFSSYLKSSAYISYVKKQLPPDKNIVLIVPDAQTAKLFSFPTRIQKDLEGIRAISGPVIYDYTIEAFLSSHSEDIRSLCIGVMFGEH